MKPQGYLDYYNALTNAIFNTYQIDEFGVERYHVKHRAFLLFKLTVFLDEKRGVDFFSQLFSLERTAFSYVSEKRHLTVDEMKEFDLDRVITSLFFDLKKYKLPDDIRNAITNAYPLGAGDLQGEFDTKFNLGSFQNSEWIPERFEKLKREGKRQL